MSATIIEALEACRRAEKGQALFYRALAAIAGAADEVDLAQRFHDLHADEQHHLSRLTARLIELGHSPSPLDDVSGGRAGLRDWEPIASAAEQEEVVRYERLLQAELDPGTRVLVEQIVSVERHHARELGGKWTMA